MLQFSSYLCGFISHLIGRETINLPENFSGVHDFMGKTVNFIIDPNKLLAYYMLVQFGNNWIQKVPLTAKLDSACGLAQFWASSELFFHPIISKLDSI